jgi:hypothetical protein
MEMSREVNNIRSVIPVITGIQEVKEENWIPAFADLMIEKERQVSSFRI